MIVQAQLSHYDRVDHGGGVRMSAALADSSERPRGPRRAASSYQRRASPSLGYSTLTTRSQSLSRLSLDGRLFQQQAAGDSTPSSPGGAITPSARTAGVGVVAGQYDTDAYHAWRRNGKEHALLARARKAGGDAGDFALPTNSARRGKGKAKERAAVAFVVGIPSSSEDGATDSDGASSEPSGPYTEERDGAAGPSMQDIIRFQVRIHFAVSCTDDQITEPIKARRYADPPAGAASRSERPRFVAPVRDRRLHLCTATRPTVRASDSELVTELAAAYSFGKRAGDDDDDNAESRARTWQIQPGSPRAERRCRGRSRRALNRASGKGS